MVGSARPVRSSGTDDIRVVTPIKPMEGPAPSGPRSSRDGRHGSRSSNKADGGNRLRPVRECRFVSRYPKLQGLHMESPPFPDRKRPVHFPGCEHDNRALLYFVTVCTKDRRPILATLPAQETILRAWAVSPAFLVGRYVLMPDHLHFFCAPAVYPSEPLALWMAFWKSWAARHWPERGVKLWQRDYWDTQSRVGESYSAKWEYVRANPMRAGLVPSAADWPFQGEIHPLMWHD